MPAAMRAVEDIRCFSSGVELTPCPLPQRTAGFGATLPLTVAPAKDGCPPTPVVRTGRR